MIGYGPGPGWPRHPAAPPGAFSDPPRPDIFNMGRARADESTVTSKPPARRAAARPPGPSIEEAWRNVDRLCRAIWAGHREDQPPQSLADLITTLRDDQVVPANEANMMHTIRSLRNLVVHESLKAGDHETTVARAAWAIVKRWAEKDEREAWRVVRKLTSA
jgi:hypothetical protein